MTLGVKVLTVIAGNLLATMLASQGLGAPRDAVTITETESGWIARSNPEISPSASLPVAAATQNPGIFFAANQNHTFGEHHECLELLDQIIQAYIRRLDGDKLYYSFFILCSHGKPPAPTNIRFNMYVEAKTPDFDADARAYEALAESTSVHGFAPRFADVLGIHLTFDLTAYFYENGLKTIHDERRVKSFHTSLQAYDAYLAEHGRPYLLAPEPKDTAKLYELLFGEPAARAFVIQVLPVTNRIVADFDGTLIYRDGRQGFILSRQWPVVVRNCEPSSTGMCDGRLDP